MSVERIDAAPLGVTNAAGDLYFALSDLVSEIGVLRFFLDRDGRGAVLDGLDPEIEAAIAALEKAERQP